jgi:hypothetical protein
MPCVPGCTAGLGRAVSLGDSSASQIGLQRASTGSQWAPWGLTQTDIKEFAMITPRELLDPSIAQLWTLTRLLGEQLGEGGSRARYSRDSCMP